MIPLYITLSSLVGKTGLNRMGLPLGRGGLRPGILSPQIPDDCPIRPAPFAPAPRLVVADRCPGVVHGVVHQLSEVLEHGSLVFIRGRVNVPNVAKHELLHRKGVKSCCATFWALVNPVVGPWHVSHHKILSRPATARTFLA